MEVRINDILVECVQGDITKQKGFKAVVNAANAQLAPGGGVAGAIHRAAGPELYEECKRLAPIKTGQAVITKGYNLPNEYVIHTLGPVYYREKDPEKKLAECYKNCLKLAEEYKLDSIAFCAISTGIFGYPLDEGLEVAFKTILSEIPNLRYLKRIRMVLYDDKSLNIGLEVFKKIFKDYL